MNSMDSNEMNSDSDAESYDSEDDAKSAPPPPREQRRGSVIIKDFTQADADQFLKLCKLWEGKTTDKNKSMMAKVPTRPPVLAVLAARKPRPP